jgi:hypothetical protein
MAKSNALDKWSLAAYLLMQAEETRNENSGIDQSKNARYA